MSSYVSSTNAR